MTVRLRGELHCKLDASRRLYLPKNYRRALPDELILTIDPSGSIAIFWEDGLQRFIDKHFDGLGGYSPSNKEHALFLTAFHSIAINVHVDTKGRIALPASLMAHAGIVGREVVIIGLSDHLLIANTDYRDMYTNMYTNTNIYE